MWPIFCTSLLPTNYSCRLRTTLSLSLPFSWRSDYAPTQGPTCFSPFCPWLQFWSVSITVQWSHGLPCFFLNLLVMFLSERLHWLFPLPGIFCSSCINCWCAPSLPSSHSSNVTFSERPSLTTQAKEVPLSPSTSYSAVLFCTCNQAIYFACIKLLSSSAQNVKSVMAGNLTFLSISISHH